MPTHVVADSTKNKAASVLESLREMTDIKERAPHAVHPSSRVLP